MRHPYYASVARDRARVAPSDIPHAIGVLRSPDDPMPVRIAYPAGHVGGWRWDRDDMAREPEHLRPAEAVWRLVVGKAEVEGRFTLRMGEFVELAEDAE